MPRQQIIDVSNIKSAGDLAGIFDIALVAIRNADLTSGGFPNISARQTYEAELADLETYRVKAVTGGKFK